MAGFSSLVYFATGETIPISAIMFVANGLMLAAGFRTLGKSYVSQRQWILEQRRTNTLDCMVPAIRCRRHLSNIHSVDEHAFIICSDAANVYGNGFDKLKLKMHSPKK